ncbi:hypothetical protein C5167_049230 [Papaver somniferum]|uniref:Uncharacterized protein n=1 Tax=Papaver somniferum TaxID=3469 RepID=A0A4Y7KP80_PAPSO|nr:hypothetical protein C5167_049230 [Papaver somniferum]
MDKFVIKRKITSEEFLSSSITSDVTDPQQVPSISSTQVPSSSSAHGPKVPYADVLSPQAAATVIDEEVSRWDLQTDPAMRKPILSYHPNDQDKVRRAYIVRVGFFGKVYKVFFWVTMLHRRWFFGTFVDISTST